MSVCYKIVNRAKRQYLAPDTFPGEGSKFAEFADKGGGTMYALALLMAPLQPMNNRHPMKDHPSTRLLGSWDGDVVVFLNEYGWDELYEDYDDISGEMLSFIVAHRPVSMYHLV